MPFIKVTQIPVKGKIFRAKAHWILLERARRVWLCLFLRLKTGCIPPTAIDQMFTFFAVVHGPRRQHPTTLHALEMIITITILATIYGAQNWVGIEHWGKAKVAWLWVLAVAMGEDTNRAHKGESAQHLALMRKLALNLLRQEQSAKVGIAASQ